MKIYHLSSAPFNGGAARAAFRLHEGLLRVPEVQSLWLDAGAGAHGSSVQTLQAPSRPVRLAKRLRRRHWTNIVCRHFNPTTPPASNPMGWGSVEMLSRLPVPDVWNLHWVSWFLDWETMLPWMAERAPIVWTLHDLNPLKGIWHYDPQPEELTTKRAALEEKAMELKRRFLAQVPKERLTFIGPSRWMAERCRQSSITGDFPIKHIPYGLDTGLFHPRNSTLLRGILGIEREGSVIGFIADDLNDPRKGMVPLQQALAQLSRKVSGVHLITVGKGRIDSGGLPHFHLGPVHSDLLLSSFYSACDLFVCPSLQDNLPNTVIESLACGTPVVAYAIGGLPDMIKHTINGLLVEQPGDPGGLAAAIESILPVQPPKTSNVVAPASEWPPFLFPAAHQAESYLQLYRTLA